MRGIWSREHEQRYYLEYQSMPEDANRSLPTARLENSIFRYYHVRWNAKFLC